MPKGDILAAGGKQATFQGPLSQKEGTDVFRDADPGPVPGEAPEPVFMPENIPHNGKMPVTEKPQFGYIADPAGDCLLIQRVEREHTSNLILPDSLKAKSEIGFVKAAGEAVKFYKAGDLVLFDKFASHGAEISLIDEDGIERQMLLMREYDVLTRLKKVPLSETSET